MLFSKNNKGFFIEVSEHAILLARTSEPQLPFEIEEMQECSPKDADGLAEAIKRIHGKKNPSGYVRATVGAYPSKRLVRRHSLELKRVKESGYFSELLTQQFRIDEEKYTVAVLNANDGSDYDVGSAAQKDVVFAGMMNDEVNALQDSLLNMGIYPQRLELGSVSTLGGIVDYLAFMKSRTPTLVLEIGGDATQSFIVSANGIEASRPIPQGLDSMLAVVQKELGLKDEESAKKLFHSNTFDFTGMGPLLIKRLLKELQSSIGFYEVQTGQSVGQVLITQLSQKQTWIETAIASSLGIATLKPDTVAWLQSRQISPLTEAFAKNAAEVRWFGLLSLMVQHTSPAHAAAEEKK
ncbi:MAG: hypothetical protein ABIZ81_08435 [Opitutaceae bacterium]